jgi:hypothetical protein
MIFLFADRAIQLAPQQRIWSSNPKEEDKEERVSVIDLKKTIGIVLV